MFRWPDRLMRRQFSRGTVFSLMAYTGVMFGLVSAIALSLSAIVQRAGAPIQQIMVHSDEAVPRQNMNGSTSTSEVLEGDSWMENIKKSWSSRRNADYGNQSRLQGPPAPWLFRGFGEPIAPSLGGSARRTVCVRICDGYFWPISYSTAGGNFERDQAACERSCTSPAKLYVTAGQEPEHMVDLKGQPYSRLKAAFAFRSKFDADCKCKPHPWEQEALDRHRQYAATDAQKKANRATTVTAKSSQPSRSSAKSADNRGSIKTPATADLRVADDLATGADPAAAATRLSLLNDPSGRLTRTPLTPGPEYVAPGLLLTAPAEVSQPTVPFAAPTAELTENVPASNAGIEGGEQMMRIGAVRSPAQARQSSSTVSPSVSASGNWRTKAFETR